MRKPIEEVPLEAAEGLGLDPWQAMDELTIQQAIAALDESDAELLMLYAAEDGNLRRVAQRLKRSTRQLRERVDLLIRQLREELGGRGNGTL